MNFQLSLYLSVELNIAAKTIGWYYWIRVEYRPHVLWQRHVLVANM